jgi:hypothetical protein
MNDLVINVSWEYFLGILGSIIALAYYTSGRFTRLETDVHWLSDAIRDLNIKAENISRKLFDAGSPVTLTFAGHLHLDHSGLKSYIDRRKPDLISQLRSSARFDIYRLQETAFRLMARMPFDQTFERRFNRFAFDKGMSTDLLRRIGAIYLRDLAAGRA